MHGRKTIPESVAPVLSLKVLIGHMSFHPATLFIYYGRTTFKKLFHEWLSERAQLLEAPEKTHITGKTGIQPVACLPHPSPSFIICSYNTPLLPFHTSP